MSHASRRLNRIPSFEMLEDRLVPSWSGVPPSVIAVPADAVAVSMNAQSVIQTVMMTSPVPTIHGST
jgi:hypothetical protein